jgi:hypothetical protein
MGDIDIEYDRFVFQFNGVYSSVDFSGTRTRGRDGTGGGATDARIDSELGIDTTLLECFAGYRFIDTPLKGTEENGSRIMLDGFVGGRYTNLNVDATLRSETTVTLPSGRTIEGGSALDASVSEEWFEPFVGARVGVNLSENWWLSLRGDVGGFGVDGSEFTWQAIGLVGYRWRLEGWDISVLGGYRAISQDYEDGDFGYEMLTHGPVTGISFSFAF